MVQQIGGTESGASNVLLGELAKPVAERNVVKIADINDAIRVANELAAGLERIGKEHGLASSGLKPEAVVDVATGEIKGFKPR